jgi:signal-transduction protein with cAMP-binding, CBS, and nucleotidyltransferase domain
VTDAAELRGIDLFDGTDDDQLGALLAAGTEVAFAAGDVLFRENAPAEHWWLLLAGSVDLVRHVGRDETQLGSMDVPGRWAGGFRAWDEHGAYLATGRAIVS